MDCSGQNMAMLTDLYEFTMAASYFRHNMFKPATFSLFIRQYPPYRGYFVSAGLSEVLNFLEEFRFTTEDMDYLGSRELFADDFLHYLGNLRFTGDVVAMPEGTIFFREEPVLEVTAPIIEAQFVETFIINAINLQVSIASKAARCMHAAGGRPLIDFALRRTQGIDAGLKVARAAFLAGFAGTSNTLAGKVYSIPVAGTMAHSYIMSFEEEEDAFRSFAETFPDHTVLLIDTYDTINGARKAAIIGREMAKVGKRLKGVRLDSGDMAALSREVRKILRQEDLGDATIFASGNFDEHKIAEVLREGGEIDAFGVGTKMGVSADAPFTDMAYKLVTYDGRPVLKLSTAKRTLVCAKQVFRKTWHGMFSGDTLGLRNEQIDGEPLLRPVMKEGHPLGPQESLNAMRERFRVQFMALAPQYKDLDRPAIYPVKIGPALGQVQRRAVRKLRTGTRETSH
jgi:nicotinate phosphoribosyltransferase